MWLTDRLAVRSFTGSSGVSEHYFTVEAPDDIGLQQQIDYIARSYADATKFLRLAPDTAIFRRLYVSDAANQSALIRKSALFCDPQDVAVSVVEQLPLPGAKLAMFAYHVDSPSGVIKRKMPGAHVVLESGKLRHMWTTGLCTCAKEHPSPATTQTEQVLEELAAALAGCKATLADNCVRTWIYMKDVDVFYQQMVTARKAVFDRHGLTEDTHYIASTGIEGGCEHRYDVVSMDAYSIIGLIPDQITYLKAHDRLCDPKDYKVSFERGTRIAYSDRAHLFLSGTASIDAAGNALHIGDVERQLERALANIDALLSSCDARLEDVSHFIVYLRDPADYPAVARYFAEHFPHTPRLITRGRVCRPEWLVEVEGIAVVPHADPALPPY